MIFNSGFSKSDIESLTYKELFCYIDHFFKQQSELIFDLFRMFSINNCESTLMAISGVFGKGNSSVKSYLKSIKDKKIGFLKEKESSENDIEKQFMENGFG